jgi:thiamine biosynthesis protein ThiS
MRLEINGEPREVADGLTVSGLLEALGVRSERVAVEVNLEVVRRDRRDTRALAEGDRVEIVSFVGGGS